MADFSLLPLRLFHFGLSPLNRALEILLDHHLARGI